MVGREQQVGGDPRPGRRVGSLNRVFGREQAFAAADAALESFVAESGARVLVVEGPSGIGKTRFVESLQTRWKRKTGSFTYESFDRFSQPAPYAIFGSVIRSMLRGVLALPEVERIAARRSLLQAVESNGRLVAALAPELDELLGSQPPLVDLSKDRAQARLLRALSRVIRACSRVFPQSVLALDDLQWADSGHLALGRTLISAAPRQADLFVVLTLTPDASHATLTELALAGAAASGVPVTRITLAPLSEEATSSLVHSSLGRQGSGHRMLVEWLHQRSGGNPLILRTLLGSVERQGVLARASDGSWRFDMSAALRLPVQEISALLGRRLSALPLNCRRDLQLLASVGNTLERPLAGTLLESDDLELLERLRPAIDLGVVHLDLDSVRFEHDAVVEMLRGTPTTEFLLRLVRQLETYRGPNLSVAFWVVDLKNQVSDALSAQSDQLRLVEQNLEAGQLALTSVDATRACGYFEVAAELLAAIKADSNGQMWPDLESKSALWWAESLLLCGELVRAHEALDSAADRFESGRGRIDAGILRVRINLAEDKLDQALDLGFQLLESLGVELVGDDSAYTVFDEHELLDLALAYEPQVLEARDLLLQLFPAVWVARPSLKSTLVATLLKHSQDHGLSAETAHAYIRKGALLVSRNQIDAGYQAARTGLAVFSRCPSPLLEITAVYVFNVSIQHFRESTWSTLKPLAQVRQGALELGETPYAFYATNALTRNFLLSGGDVAEAARKCEDARQLFVGIGWSWLLQLESIKERFCAALTGRASPSSIADLDELRREADRGHLPVYEQALFWSALVSFYFNDYRAALKNGGICLGRLNLLSLTAAEPVLHLVLAISQLRVRSRPNRAAIKQVNAHLNQIRIWARHAPQVYDHRVALIEAELARVNDQPNAMSAYSRAIEGAGASGLGNEEALAWELAGRYLHANRQPYVAASYLLQARRRYRRWGALAKVEQLEETFGLATAQFLAVPGGSEVSDLGSGQVQFDVMTLIRATQALSSSNREDELHRRLTGLLAETVGAHRSMLFLARPDGLNAVAESDETGVRLLPAAPLGLIDTSAPRTMLSAAFQKAETLVLDEPSRDPRFHTDPYLRAVRPLSTLTMPILRQGEPVGVIYLEHRSARGAFAGQHLEVIKGLAAQFVISSDNVRLYHDTWALNDKLRREVSERRSAEEERGRLREQLRQAQKMEAIGQLAGGVAHDFNNLFTGVAGYLELIRSEAPNQPSILEYIDEIRRSVEQAGLLTRQLLAFSRKQTLRPRVIDVNPAVARLMQMLQRMVGDQIRISSELDEVSGRVLFDPTQFEQVLVNLVVNARDAISGHGEITVETSLVTLDARYAQGELDAHPGPHVLIVVRDSGAGMDEETQVRAFEPFFSTKDEGRGTGLGLSTVYGIVKQSGGHVRMESLVGLGTAVHVYLPRTDREAEIDAPQTPLPRKPAEGRERVMLVEDDMQLRPLVKRILARLGYEVLSARNGLEALKMLQDADGAVQLILTDVMMPKVGGVELARRARALWPDLKILFMSGYADVEAYANIEQFPNSDLLKKPFMPNELAAKVRQMLGG